jgi:hypothetical protein
MGKCHVEGCDVRPALNECYDYVDERYYDICEFHKTEFDEGKNLKWKSGLKKKIHMIGQRL